MTPPLALALAAALTAGAPAPAGPARGAWAAFVDAPTRGRYERVVEAVGACADASCARSVAPDADTVARLVKLVGVGVPLAADAAMDAYPLLSGRELEEVARALGTYSDAHPWRFLRTAQEHHLPPAALQRIVRTLPAGVGEDEAARQAALDRRIQALSGVDEPGVATVRAAALEALRPAPDRRREARWGPPGR